MHNATYNNSTTDREYNASLGSSMNTKRGISFLARDEVILGMARVLMEGGSSPHYPQYKNGFLTFREKVERKLFLVTHF